MLKTIKNFRDEYPILAAKSLRGDMPRKPALSAAEGVGRPRSIVDPAFLLADQASRDRVQHSVQKVDGLGGGVAAADF